MSPRASSTFARLLGPAAVAFVLVALLGASGGAPSTDPTLPAPEDLLPRLRDSLRANADLFGPYRFRQRITSRERDPDGAVTRTTVREYEVRPNAWGAPAEWVLLRVNGTRVPRARIEQGRAKNRERWNVSPEKLARLRRQAAAEQAEIEEAIDEVFRIVEVRVVGRATQAGRSAIEIAFEPRPELDAKTSFGKIFHKARGRVWVDEADGQLVRFEGEAFDTIVYGWGVVARVHAGTRLVLERRLVDDEVWLPASYHLRGSARMLLFKVNRFDRRSEFFEYERTDAAATAAAR
jgi:hypothetical protein